MPKHLLYHNKEYFSDSTYVFCDAAQVVSPRGNRYFYGAVIGKLPQQKSCYGELFSALNNNNEAEAMALVEGMRNSTGNIVLVTDNSNVADLISHFLEGKIIKHHPWHNNDAVTELQKKLKEHHDRIDAIYFSPKPYAFPEQLQADRLCRLVSRQAREDAKRGIALQESHAAGVGTSRSGDDRERD